MVSDSHRTSSLARFTVLWSGQFVSSIGSGLTAFGLATYLFQRTNSATAVAIVTLCAFLPPVVLAPFAGMLADRHDRRLLMIAADGLSILGLAYVCFAVTIGDPSPWQIYAGVAFSALFSSLLDPAYRASVTDLLDEDQYARASGMVQLAGSAKYLVSPVVAGFLYPWCGVGGILLIDMSTFALTVATTLAVRRRVGRGPVAREPSARWTTEFSDGLRALRAGPGVLMVVVVLAVGTFCVGFLETLFPPMMLSFSTPETLGVIMAVAATGMLVGSLVLSTVKVTTRYFRELLIGLGLAGVFIVGVGATANVFVIGAAGFCFFACLPFVNTPAEVLIRTAIPNESQGRAWGLVSLLSNLGYLVAYASAGPLADGVFTPLFGHLGPGRGIGVLIMTVGALLTLAAVVLGITRRSHCRDRQMA